MNINFRRWGCGGQPKVYNEEHNKMVSLSKINLCCSGWTENGAYTSVRNYKIMGAGGFVLELYRDGVYRAIPLGVFSCYKNLNDLTESIRYWLDHKKEREKIAERGYRWVHSHATYTHRIKKALEIMGL
jgi:spore maturation protein CgeB